MTAYRSGLLPNTSRHYSCDCRKPSHLESSSYTLLASTRSSLIILVLFAPSYRLWKACRRKARNDPASRVASEYWLTISILVSVAHVMSNRSVSPLRMHLSPALRTIVLLYFVFPQTKAAERIYGVLIHPILTRCEPLIDIMFSESPVLLVNIKTSIYAALPFDMSAVEGQLQTAVDVTIRVLQLVALTWARFFIQPLRSVLHSTRDIEEWLTNQIPELDRQVRSRRSELESLLDDYSRSAGTRNPHLDDLAEDVDLPTAALLVSDATGGTTMVTEGSTNSQGQTLRRSRSLNSLPPVSRRRTPVSSDEPASNEN